MHPIKNYKHSNLQNHAVMSANSEQVNTTVKSQYN
jgi:hypothetical protein